MVFIRHAGPAQLHRISRASAVSPRCFFYKHTASTSASSQKASGITLTTQVSLDRWPKASQQAKAWQGTVSIAVYIPAPAFSSESRQYEQHLRKLIQLHMASSQPGSNITVSVQHSSFYAREGAQVLLPGTRSPSRAPSPSSLSSSADSYDSLYPINALRNLAILAADTDLVLMLDADMMPSAHASEGLLHAYHQITGSTDEQGMTSQAPHPRQRVMLLLPAFELTGMSLTAEDVSGEQMPMPRTKVELAALGAYVTPAHCGKYPPRATSLDYSRWWGSAANGSAAADAATATSGTANAATANGEVFDAPYYEYFEPYGVASRSSLPSPPFDERFRGYGLNKVQMAYHLAALGFCFKVSPDHFVVSAPHPRSPSFTATFGPATGPQNRERVEQLYKQFKDEIQHATGFRAQL